MFIFILTLTSLFSFFYYVCLYIKNIYYEQCVVEIFYHQIISRQNSKKVQALSCQIKLVKSSRYNGCLKASV